MATLCPYYTVYACLYLAIIMYRHEGPQTSLSIALHAGVYLVIIMHSHERPYIALTIALIEAST
jgi:hypothetical protein